MWRYGIFFIAFLSSNPVFAEIQNTKAPVSEVSYGDCVVRHTIYGREYKPKEKAKKYFSHNPVEFIKDECADASRIALGFKGKKIFLDKVSGELPNNNMSGSAFLCAPGDTDEFGCIRNIKAKDVRVGKKLVYKNKDYRVSITIGKIIESQRLSFDSEDCVEYWREAKVTLSDSKSTWHIPATISGGACP